MRATPQWSSCLKPTDRQGPCLTLTIAAAWNGRGLALVGLGELADALDSYDEPPPYDAALDEPNDAYLEAWAFNALNFLDPQSWRHYLPRLIDYALRNIASHAPGTMAIDGLLWSLRPPDRDPPRLGSLTPAQKEVVVAALDQLAFADDSVYRADAMQVMEEWWLG